MNREQRRRYNKAHKTNYTKQEFDMMIAVDRIKRGIAEFDDLDLPRNFMHMDNTELCPDGTEVKLNFDSLEARCKTVDSSNKLFRDWVAEAKKDPDRIYHLTREGARNSLVCLEEDDREVELDGKMVKAPRWLFDLMADIFIFVQGKWVSPAAVDKKFFVPYSEIRPSNK